MFINMGMFKLKDSTEANIAALREKLLRMKGNIGQLNDITVKANRRPGVFSYDVVMISKFDSMERFEESIPHPAHVDVGKYIQDVCEQVATVCYEE